jgi:sigma-B regulation protein RsbU (phosphoserine phosphatase)
MTTPNQSVVVASSPGRFHAQTEQLRRTWARAKFRLRRAWWHAADGWLHLTEGMELDDLWKQFKADARVSSRLYKQDLENHVQPHDASWKRPFRILAALFVSILKKLSPARRVFLIVTIVLAVVGVTGVVVFVPKEVFFLAAFVGLLGLLMLVLGDHVSMKRDIEIAREIQRLLVPHVPPDVPGVDMAFATRPANTVAGDYYDAFRRAEDGPLLIAVADVSGKSVPAAMLMANFQASLRALAGSPGTLSELVAGLNRLACGNNLNGRRFTTAFFAELNPSTGELIYLSAGHNPPLLMRSDGSVERLKSECIPLGIDLAEKFETGVTHLRTNDLLVIYTDGVTEARNEQGDQFGESRLLGILEPGSPERAASTLASIMNRLDDFVGNAPQHDDITCLVVSRSGSLRVHSSLIV